MDNEDEVKRMVPRDIARGEVTVRTPTGSCIGREGGEVQGSAIKDQAMEHSILQLRGGASDDGATRRWGKKTFNQCSWHEH